jgi:hypothetical protein
MSNITGRIRHMIGLAIDEALKSSVNLKHGAVLFGQGGQRVYHHARNDHGNRICGYRVPSIHAEANCLHWIYRQTHRMKKLNILVIRLNCDGQLTDSRPCCMCEHLMRQFHIYRVYYSDHNGEICCQRIDEQNCEGIGKVSHGLVLLIEKMGDDIRTANLPLSKQHKTTIFRLYL